MSAAHPPSGCLWTDGPPSAPAPPDEPVPARADVAIVGGGYTGLSAARALARLGAHAVVLERETAGWGASSRNGGMVLSGYKPATTAIARRLGDAPTAELHALSLDALRALEELIAGEGIACEYSRCGHLSVAAKPSHFPRLRAEHDALGRLPGMGAELLTPDEARRELGSSHYHGALLDPAGGSLQPATYLAGLADAARRAGASLCERTEARRLTRAPGGFSIDTSRGAIHARDVLIATNGYTGALTPALRRRVVPIGSHIIATEPLTADLARELIPQRRVVSDTRNLLFYFRLSTDNRMVFGGRASFTPTSLARTSAILRRGMVTVFPQLAGVQVTHGWGGNVCFTLDELPHAGRLDGIHYALGYCGHGVAMATYLGAWMGEAIAGRRALPPFASHRFPAIPFYEGVPWFLPLAGAWFRALDFL